ncbi:hypothetical protein ACOKM5_43030 [Streptomyces sp. BH097]|uniref:hypothetical protein n=1 Tax=unclassified Streptomyces TaxID=2593676 RepID=UPI003BB5B32B
MTTPAYVPVMELIRAGLDPASHQEGVHAPVDLPTGRVVAAAARADVDDDGMRNISLLAAGIAMAAIGLTAELAGRRGQEPEEFLDSMEGAARSDDGFDGNGELVQVLRGMLSDQGAAASELMGQIFARDQAQLFDLLVEFGAYCGTCIKLLERVFQVPVDEVLQDLEDMLKETSPSS